MFSSGARSWWFKTGNNTFSALDIGHHKIVCLIAQKIRGNELLVLGRGVTKSAGVDKGIVDRKDLCEAITQAVNEAAGRVSGSGQAAAYNIHVAGPLHSAEAVSETGVLKVGGDSVNPSHVYEALARAAPPHDPFPRERLHSIALDFAINDLWGVSDPLGYRADDLKAKVQLVSADKSEVHNLVAAIRECDLNLKALTLPVLASAHACLSDEDRKLGTLFLDLGAGGTHIAVYTDGLCRHLGSVPLGGKSLTHALARVLNISTEDAEREKTLRGHLRVRRRPVEVPQAPLINLMSGSGMATHQQIVDFPQEAIESLRKGMDDIVAAIKTSLRDVPNIAGVSRIAVTGGGSQLQGMVSYLEESFHLPVRLCKPFGVRGGTRADDFKFDPTSSPGDSTCVGLLRMVTHPLTEYSLGVSNEMINPSRNWLRVFGLTRPTPTSD